MRQWRLAEAATLLRDLLSRDSGGGSGGDGEGQSVVLTREEGDPGVVVLAHHSAQADQLHACDETQSSMVSSCTKPKASLLVE